MVTRLMIIDDLSYYAVKVLCHQHLGLQHYLAAVTSSVERLHSCE